MNTPQQTYDTLLVVGWKKDWNFRALVKECFDRGIDVMEVDRRSFKKRYSGGIPVRASIHESCKLMDDHLWRCKNFKDFLTVRDNLWAGAYTFKCKDQTMISEDDKKKHKAVLDKVNADIDMKKSIKEGAHKLGGCNATKRNGRKK